MATRSKELIVRGLVEVIVGSTMPIRVWGPLVFPNPEHAFELHARVAAFPILYGCIRDMVEAGQSTVLLVAEEARKAGFGNLGVNAIRFADRCNLGLPILEMFDEEEQVLLALLRDRLAHGYLSGTSNQHRKVKVIRDRKVEKVKFDRDALDKIVKKNFPSGDLVKIDPMINRVSNTFADYVTKIEEYNVPVHELTAGLMEDGIVFFET